MSNYNDKVVIIGRIGDEDSKNLFVQDFVSNDERYIPVFSSIESFREQIIGSGFEDMGIEIDIALLIDTIGRDAKIVLDPGKGNQEKIRLSDLIGVTKA